MSGPPVEADDPPGEDWLVTYADAITLLMAFFVMMFSISEPSPEKFDAVADSIISELSGKDPIAKNTPFQNMAKAMKAEESEDSDVNSTKQGTTFNFKSSKLFKPGSAKLLPAAIPVLDRVAQLISFMGITNYSVDVEGHTDDIPIRTQQYPSNWELSATRATNVVRFLISRGIEPERLRAIGFADTRPKVPHRDAEGQLIKKNLVENRRVTIRVERKRRR